MNSGTGRIAIVTGGSRGIGRAIAAELAAQGHAVTLTWTSREAEARDAVREIESSGGAAQAVRADVRNERDLDALFAAVLDRFGRLDVLVNNAGVGAACPLDQIGTGLFTLAMETNVLGSLLACRRAATAFADRGGAIVNVSSALVSQPFPGQSVYAASKAAVEALTRTLAQELGPRGIRVNAVAPGAVDTDQLPKDEQIRAFVASRTTLGRVGQPRDIARVVAFLASDAAAWVTGQVLGVDGGLRL